MADGRLRRALGYGPLQILQGARLVRKRVTGRIERRDDHVWNARRLAVDFGQRRRDGGEGVPGGDAGGAGAERQRDWILRREAGRVGLDRGADRGRVVPVGRGEVGGARPQAGVEVRECAGGWLAALAGGDQFAARVAQGFPALALLMRRDDRVGERLRVVGDERVRFRSRCPCPRRRRWW